MIKKGKNRINKFPIQFYTQLHIQLNNLGLLQECLGMCVSKMDTQDKILYQGGARGVMVIVVENGHGDTSSNPGRD